MAIAALRAQSPDTTDWQTSAGGRVAFEVASVKPSMEFRPPLFPLDVRNAKSPGGRFFARASLWIYIAFAYKLSPPDERQQAQLPKWVSTDLFEIEARAQGNPTKDQMRLMMQSLLADRFKLAVHFESREAAVFDLVLVKPTKPGPKLRPHAEGPPCPDSFTLGAAPPVPGEVFPPYCDTASMRAINGVRMVGSRNVTMPFVADAIRSYGGMAGEVDRWVVDRTGLNGKFDLTIEYGPGESDQFRRPGPPNPDAPPPDSQGTPFLNAVREQLGLKLVSSKASIRMLVVDHVERPSEN
jgi:bla regulator protein BlaR1